jgi:Gpi18-like mannosyltransferase
MPKKQPSPVLLKPGAVQEKRVGAQAFIALGAFAMTARLVLAPWMAHSGDMATFMGWGQRLADIGPGAFLDNGYWCDYLPGYLYILWAVGELAAHLHLNLRMLLFKLPNLLADVATAYLIWRALRPTEEDRKLWVPALYLFNPAVLMNSTIWGQADSFHALCLVGGLTLLLNRRLFASAVVFGFAVAVKPHTVFLLPLVGMYAILAREALHRVGICIVIVAAVFTLTFLPFADWSISSVPGFIRGHVGKVAEQYAFATVNAMNFWYLLGKNWVPDEQVLWGSASIRLVGIFLCCVGFAFALVWSGLRRRRRGDIVLWEGAAIIYLVTFLFITRAHERHVFPFFAMLAVVMGTRRGATIPYALLSGAYCLNMVLALRYMIPGNASGELCHPVAGAIVCALNVLTLPMIVASFTDWGDRGYARLAATFGPVAAALGRVFTLEVRWTPRATLLALAGIVLFALSVRLTRLNTPNERFFDEVYHAYTAERWVQGDTNAWLWSTKAPDEGCAYEWTHPPLAKLFMAWSMQVFGVQPWAWRLPAALLGTLSVFLIYLIARALFDSRPLALLVATLASLDSLPLLLSRIGMNDIYCTTFILLAVLAVLRKRFVAAPFAAGAALACKWTALYAFPLLALILMVRVPAEERWRPSRLFTQFALYLVVVPLMYVGSYVPFFWAGHAWSDFVEVQRQMWYYHTHLKSTHSFSSKAWQWPFTRGAVWCYTHQFAEVREEADDAAFEECEEEAEGLGENEADVEDDSADVPATDTARTANIYAMGNPMIWLAGLGSVLFTCIQIAQRRDPTLIILVVGYLMFWAPWLASPRIMFLYHYLPALPFMYIALAWSIVYTRVHRGHIRVYLLLVAMAFAATYPYATAVPMPKGLAPSGFFWSKWFKPAGQADATGRPPDAQGAGGN